MFINLVMFIYWLVIKLTMFLKGSYYAKLYNNF